MNSLNDTWMRISGIPLMAFLGQWGMYGYTGVPYPNDWRVPVFFVLASIVVWEGSRWGILISRRRYPELTQTARRILFQLGWFVVCASLVRVSQTYLYHRIGLWPSEDYFLLKPYFFNTLVSVVMTVQVAAAFEAIYLYQRWKQTYTETQELKRTNLQSQLESLQMQINPHFLFNSLNSLLSLINENPQQAELFTEELSSVYRYVLRVNERNLTELQLELEFIQSYFYLLKTRHGSGLHLVVSVDECYHSYQLPPLTLQLLVENAVKHNAVLTNQPLVITIATDAQQNLVVSNNLQKKPMRVLSNGIGLSNILTKYLMLGQAVPTIQETEKQFVVSLPLLNPA